MIDIKVKIPKIKYIRNDFNNQIRRSESGRKVVTLI